ncbi:hypothetical protein PHMEG_0004623 [Phytophthora megakarya]|uniref:Uncharacterized protein n=1 Tax=Phytophthora megakarya TaxID=4795 RepID=A0A225WTI6_9STRA|nr:hypothetical protein PHMEG_0004623 [Phytophthora megakarya]
MLDEHLRNTDREYVEASNTQEVVIVIPRVLRKGVNLRYVHPHLCLSILVCLWVGKRGWEEPRQRYKEYDVRALRKRGLHDLARRQRQNVVLRQQRTPRAPKKTQIASIYWQARRHAEELSVAGWNEVNKANHRIATKVISITAATNRRRHGPELPEKYVTITKWLGNDIRH